MADHLEVQYATALGNGYPAHEQMYRNFVIVVLLIGMAPDLI